MRTVLVTGAARNIGAQVAKDFASNGYRVALNATIPDEIEEVKRTINKSGGQAIAVPGDIRDPEQVQRVIDYVGDQYGGVDVLVNNAMVRKHELIERTSIEDWHAVLDVVLTGSFNCVKAVLPHMRTNGWGRIINMGGVAGQTGAVGRVAVVAAKSGLFGLTKAVALETAKEGITANVISPGIIATNRGDLERIGDVTTVRSHYEDEIALIPVGRPGCIDEISGTCIFLASETAAFMTGQVLGVNGGRHM